MWRCLTAFRDVIRRRSRHGAWERMPTIQCTLAHLLGLFFGSECQPVASGLDRTEILLAESHYYRRQTIRFIAGAMCVSSSHSRPGCRFVGWRWLRRDGITDTRDVVKLFVGQQRRQRSRGVNRAAARQTDTGTCIHTNNTRNERLTQESWRMAAI